MAKKQQTNEKLPENFATATLPRNVKETQHLVVKLLPNTDTHPQRFYEDDVLTHKVGHSREISRPKIKTRRPVAFILPYMTSALLLYRPDLNAGM